MITETLDQLLCCAVTDADVFTMQAASGDVQQVTLPEGTV
jgi:hypothetical protein